MHLQHKPQVKRRCGPACAPPSTWLPSIRFFPFPSACLPHSTQLPLSSTIPLIVHHIPALIPSHLPAAVPHCPRSWTAATATGPWPPFLSPFCDACRICNIWMFHCHPILLPSWWHCIPHCCSMLMVPCPPLVPFLPGCRYCAGSWLVLCLLWLSQAVIAPGLPLGIPHSHWASPRADGHALCPSCCPLGVAVVLGPRASLASPGILAVVIALRSVDSM